MAALLAGIREGDEVIMPSYTFVSTANPFVLRGAKIIFVDIRPDTLNIDENLIEDAVTGKTRAIVPMHYGGVGCEMETILKIAAEYNVTVIEDAAQAMMAKYKGRYLGTLGQIGAFSFHDTKNYTCGEGGAVLINDPGLTGQAEILREKGTDRSEFLRGEIDRYTWVDMGSSYLPSELNAAFLWAQLEMADEINEQRLKCWQLYREKLKPLQQRGLIELPTVPQGCEHNGHVFYVKLKDLPTRTRLMDFLRQNGIDCRFHFIPLHSSAAGKRFGRFHGRDQWTTRESQRMLRLPVYYGITEAQIGKVCGKVMRFFKG
jgi:dTDP-4-amino-4,6-dideoxygalactose transaminase